MTDSVKSAFVEIVDEFVSTGSEIEALRLIHYAKATKLPPPDIAHLASKLGTSGKVIRHDTSTPVADFSSTGGPTSLSTILCPIYLRHRGYCVVSIGVPGRPAGAIDVLAQIPGYNIEPDEASIVGIVSKSGLVHVVANQFFAPLDALLFKLRQTNSAQQVPSLVIASLIAKKIAAGVTKFGLDVRVAPGGNFGKNWEEARENAFLFCRVANLLDLKVKCFLTDARLPYQPYIGRGEALLAISMLMAGNMRSDLAQHVIECYQMSALSDRDQIDDILPDITNIFERNLDDQGSDLDKFSSKCFQVQESHSGCEIFAKRSGYIRIDMVGIRSAIGEAQAIHSSGERFSDPVGLILSKGNNEHILEGEPICSIRTERGCEYLRDHLESKVKISDKPFGREKGEIIGYE